MLNISFDTKDLYENEAIVVLINDQMQLDQTIIEIDQRFHGIISKTIQNSNKFKGKFGQTFTVTSVDKHGSIKSIIIIGIGSESKIAEYQIEELGGRIFSAAKIVKAVSIGLFVSSKINDFTQKEVSSLIASGAMLSAYKFDHYFTKNKSEKFCVKDFNIIVENSDDAYKFFESKKAVVKGVYFARDLTSELPNILYPETYVEQIIEKLEPLGIEVTVLGEREMRHLGMGALLGVGQGSDKESKMVIMKYNGVDNDQKPVCFVGKGVTFDTGGISIKPASGMSDMKHDMAGSATVVGVIKALALRGAKVNVVGVVGLVENMPDGNAQRPGDVVKTMSGQTVEILNTDAEGRLVLCDCLTYLQENFDPECIVDLATLTGAITVSLAHTYAGIFSNDDQLSDRLIKSSMATNEKLWRMPLHEDYDNMIKSPVADMANIGSEKGAAGSSTAAQFLLRFIKDDVKWAHLDIAGVAWDKIGKNPICPKGATGYGVRLLNQFIADNYEIK
ncbi:MAG: leucyl aminopeptidase [Rickettsiales bacterium]|nr:MAG: leucyl aminopeptidase [Rickettsiales bacterium]